MTISSFVSLHSNHDDAVITTLSLALNNNYHNVVITTLSLSLHSDKSLYSDNGDVKENT